jgi:CheY-like chemotaxis protein
VQAKESSTQKQHSEATSVALGSASMFVENRFVFFSVTLLSLGLIGWLDYITGYELSFFVFYFIPISLAAWHRGKTAGVVIATISILIWSLIANWTNMPFSSVFYEIWNTAVRYISFLAIAISMARMSAEISALRKLLPICSCCKMIRDDAGYWQQLESYFHKHIKTNFSHGICPECAQKFYKPNVLFVDDKADDAAVLKHAFAKAGLPHNLHWVENKQKAMQWLLGSGEYHDRNKYPFADILVLDAAAPNTALDLLSWVRSTTELKKLPVLMAGLEDHEQVRRAYELNANTCFSKSAEYRELTDFLSASQA